MTKYVWRTGTPILTKIDAQVAGERLEQVRVASNGHLTPSAVVDDARPDDSPLHKAFEWDDAKAAQAHRVDQARFLISRIAVVVSDEKANQEKTIKAFVSVSNEDGQRYTSIAHAMSDDALRAQVLKRAWAELQGWQTRYKELQEFSAVVSAIESVKELVAA